MKLECILISAFCVVSCTNTPGTIKSESSKNEYDYSVEYPNVDIRKKYPEKTIRLDEIASIEYIPLETTENIILSSPRWISSTRSGDTIVLGDMIQNKIFIFKGDGRYLNSFERKGGGGQEYTALSYLIVDWTKKEIFAWDIFLDKIVVYSFDGEFKRVLKLAEKIYPASLFDYDVDFLIGYDDRNLDHERKQSMSETPYFLISKKTGEVSFLPIHLKQRIGNSYWFYNEKGVASNLSSLNIETMIKTSKGVIISDFAKDTVFLYENHKLIPIAIHNGIYIDKNEPWLFSLCLNSNQRMFFYVIKKKIDKGTQSVMGIEPKFLMYDKKEKRIYNAKLQLPDIEGSENILWTKYEQDISNDEFIYPISTAYLFELNQRGKIKGRLKEFLTHLNEDDNHVLIKIKFKD